MWRNLYYSVSNYQWTGYSGKINSLSINLACLQHFICYQIKYTLPFDLTTTITFSHIFSTEKVYDSLERNLFSQVHLKYYKKVGFIKKFSLSIYIFACVSSGDKMNRPTVF